MNVQIYKIIKITAGGFHAWCESSVGKIRKPTNMIRVDKIPRPMEDERDFNPVILLVKLKWYKRLWNWIKKLCQRNQ